MESFVLGKPQLAGSTLFKVPARFFSQSLSLENNL
jgi:hypothetical protein